MTQRPAMRLHAALLSALWPDAAVRPLLRTAIGSTTDLALQRVLHVRRVRGLRGLRRGLPAPRAASDAGSVSLRPPLPTFDEAQTGAQGWRSALRRMMDALLRPLLAVLPLLMVALWHASTLAQPVTATPQEAAVVMELQVLQSQQALVSLRKLKTDQGTIELLLHPRSNRYYIAVTSRTGQVRRVVRADNERAAQLGFDSFRRLAGQGEAGRPALLGETLAEAGAGGAAQPQPQPQTEARDPGATTTSVRSRVPVQGQQQPQQPQQAQAQGQAQATPLAAPQAAAQPQAQAQPSTLARAPAPLRAQMSASTPPAALAAPTVGATNTGAGAGAGGAAATSAHTAATAAPLTAAAAPAPAAVPAPAPTLAPPRSPLMDEVLRLQSAGQLTSMRRADNGSFNAQLFFHVGTARYFVVLAHDKDLWRVVQAQDSAQALRTYEELAGQSAALAGDELRRLELKAQTDAAERELRQAQAQARQMAEELEADRRYRAMIQAQENQSRADVSALQQQQRQIQEQLMAEQRRVMELRRQLDPSVAAGASNGGGRKGAADCRMPRPGVPVPASERDLPICGVEGRARAP
ncbi:DUF2968 family protein [Roseateles depolymerans]|uniref:Uncharacterized protein n=1 Tax=Roseateles depolymerans TaxID=76731 RepID=A0A0U3MAM9_9BURK|nr:hypothetical protein RD2015_857 [Roseateles depolymerans]REG14631.1 DUF2968 family protein [Roseateles depolymerans]